MAIRTISYSVKSDGISPNTEQQAGLQSEHAVTQLVFTLDSTLYQELLSEKQDGDTLVYRFDCCDSMGGAVKTEPSTLTSDTVTFTVGENLTRSGGKARVYLVISRYNSEEKTETELLSFPAKLRFENVPETDSDNGNSQESLSTLTEAAKNAAERAKQSADTAVEAQGKTEAARLAIEDGSTVIFDGNGTFGKADVDFVIDTELSTESDNAIANKVVAIKTKELFALINQVKKETLLASHPIHSFFYSSDPIDPSTLFGGTWVQIKDTFLLAAGDTYRAGTTGGAKEHSHNIDPDKAYAQFYSSDGTELFTGWRRGVNSKSWDSTEHFLMNGYSTGQQTVDGGVGVYGTSDEANNMPPYLAVYVWKRTA
ncbi:MAG: phage baseplate protein [Acutalibacteraceae bacterium]